MNLEFSLIESILDKLYQAEILDLDPHFNQFTLVSYKGNGIIVPEDHTVKVSKSGVITCSPVDFFDYLLSFAHNEDFPDKKRKYRRLSELLKKYNIKTPELFEFPNEESKWTWLGAMLDAESSISLIKSRKKTKRGFQYIPKLSCSSTTPELLLQMLKACHPYGCLSSHHYQDKRSTFWKQTKKFTINSTGLRILLPKILPYLVIKKHRALLLLESIDLLSYGKKELSEENRLFEIWENLRNLNKRGNK